MVSSSSLVRRMGSRSKGIKRRTRKKRASGLQKIGGNHDAEEEVMTWQGSMLKEGPSP